MVKQIKDYMSEFKAAQFLGITPNTLCRWALAGTIKHYTHPNRRRMYLPEDLMMKLRSIQGEPTPQEIKEK